jgi:hypothetical protein
MRHKPPHALIQTMTRHTKSELTVGSPKSVTIDWLELKKITVLYTKSVDLKKKKYMNLNSDETIDYQH